MGGGGFEPTAGREHLSFLHCGYILFQDASQAKKKVFADKKKTPGCKCWHLEPTEMKAYKRPYSRLCAEVAEYISMEF